MTTKDIPEVGEDEAAPVRVISANPDAEEVKTVRTTKRSDAAQTFIQSWLSNHPVAAGSFTAAHAVALIEAIDAADPSKK